MGEIKAWAANSAGGRLELTSYDPGPLGPDEVEVAVDHCGVCHSDLSMLDNDWGFTAYPFVPGHEAIGRIVALGDEAASKGLRSASGLASAGSQAVAFTATPVCAATSTSAWPCSRRS
jgi:uncharacterized zinc-type alcohol dehydrogenase-like protein